MKRMYGDFEMMENGPFPETKRSTARKRRQDTSFTDNQSKPNKLPTKGQPADSGRYKHFFFKFSNIPHVKERYTQE